MSVLSLSLSSSSTVVLLRLFVYRLSLFGVICTVGVFVLTLSLTLIVLKKRVISCQFKKKKFRLETFYLKVFSPSLSSSYSMIN